MDPALIPAIHFTMHPSGVWTSDGDRETFVGPCNTQILVPAGSPDISELTRLFFRSVSITRPALPIPESSDEEDPEEGSTPPLSPQMMPIFDDEHMLPLEALPLDAVPMIEDEPDQMHYLTDESEEFEEAPVDAAPVGFLNDDVEEDPNGPIYIPGADLDMEEDWADEEMEEEEELMEEHEEDVPDWVLDEMEDFGYESDLSAVSGLTSLDSMSDVDSHASS